MEKILFLNDFYYPKPLPNAICLHRVAEELLKMGYEVHIIAYKQRHQNNIREHEGIFIHYIQMRLFYKLLSYANENINTLTGKITYRLAKAINKVTKLINLPKFPLASSLTVRRYYKKASKLHLEHKFKLVIALFNPEETLFAAVKLKRNYPELKFGAYILDSLIFLSGKKKLPPFLRDKLSWKFEKMVYESADMVYNMETHKVHHQHKKYVPYLNKIKFLDIPLFGPKQLILTQKLYNIDKKHLVYMGTLFKTFRNPDYMYRLFLRINSQNDYQLHFYTRGDCEDRVIEFQKETNGAIKRHGYVPHSEIENIYANAHYLINLGVSNSTNISSKIFDYMSFGKPIIHFYYLDNDVNLRYFKNYQLALMIKMDETLFEENANNLKRFLSENSEKTLDSSYLTKNFRKNLPEYTAKEFVKLTHK